MKFNFKKTAFTLSEVLITITLIGFLATMTLATIGSSVQQRARLAEFRTAYAKIDNALRHTVDELGRIPNCYDYDEGVWTDFGLHLNGESISATSTECSLLAGMLARNMSAIKTCAPGEFNQCLPINYPTDSGAWSDFSNSRIYILENGMIFFAINPDNNYNIALDVNGRKGPNRWGLDIFPLTIAVTETSKLGDITRVQNIGVLPPRDANDTQDSGNLKSSAQLLKDSVGFIDQ